MRSPKYFSQIPVCRLSELCIRKASVTVPRPCARDGAACTQAVIPIGTELRARDRPGPCVRPNRVMMLASFGARAIVHGDSRESLPARCDLFHTLLGRSFW